jgi:16S rRNA processing protein RimM
MTTDLVRIGTLGRAHGVQGEIALDGASLSIEELERVRIFTWRRSGVPPRHLTLETARPTTGRLLVRFAGVRDRDQASALTRGELMADRAALPDPGPGVAYTFQIVGLRVVELDGREIGVVADVIPTGAHPIWVVRGAREVLVPATPEVVRRVDLEAGVITVALPAGLEDL